MNNLEIILNQNLEIILKDEREEFNPEKSLEKFLSDNLEKILLPLIPPPLKGDDGYTPKKGKDYKDGEDGATPVKGVDYFTKKEVSEIKKAIKDTILSELPKIITEEEINVKFTDIVKKIEKLPKGGGGALFLRQLMDVNVGVLDNLQYAFTYNKSRSEFTLTAITGGGVWGSITGTLSDQTDLQNALDDRVPYTGATGDINIGTHGITAHNIKGDASDGLLIEANNGTDVGILGAGNTANVTWYGNHIYTQMTGGSVPFFGSNGLLSQDNQGFYYDNTENRLSIFTTLGSEVITNGTFTGSATGWTLGSGWAYSSNAVNKSSNGTATLSQTISLYLQRGYLLTYTISNWTAGSVTPALGGFTGTTVSANGTYTERFVATSSASITFTPTNTARFTIDSVSVKPLTGTNTKSNLNVGGLSVEGSWSNGTPNTTRALTFNNDGSNSWIDYRFSGVLRGSTGYNSSGGYDVYVSGGNGQAWYWGNAGLTSNSLYSYNFSSGFVHYGYGYFGGNVNAGSAGSTNLTLNSTGSFGSKGRRVTGNSTVLSTDSVIYADASSAACSGTPTYSCSHWTNQSDCEKWDAHGGCTWFSGYSCSVYNGDQGGCQGQSGCTYDTASCSGFGDETTCNSYSGCSWTNNPISCSGFDETTCGSTTGCSVNYDYCSNYSDGGGDGTACGTVSGYGCTYDSGTGVCSGVPGYWFTSCSGSYDNYTCDGSYYTGNCSGNYGTQCQGTSSCSGIDDSTNCGFETGCTWSTSLTINLPSVLTVPNMHLWVYNDSSTNADVICQPYSGDTIDKTTSYTLSNYKDAIHAHAFSEATSCGSFNEGACTPSGCTKQYSNCVWDSMGGTCSGNAVCTGIGDQMTCESTTYFSYCSGNYYLVKNWYLLSRS